jgi:hypothetical protein
LDRTDLDTAARVIELGWNKRPVARITLEGRMLTAFCAAIRAGNRALAGKPRFVVIGTPRAGTVYFSQLCRANGIICSHEAYFTEHGPMLRNPDRRFDAVGDVSWMAPHFLPDDGILAVHQVRHPLKVIRSIYEMGLFDPSREHTRRGRVALLRRYFTFSSDPMRSALRFYIEWNERCEAITSKRYRIEDLDNDRDKVGSWLGIELANMSSVSRSTNRRTPEISKPWDEGRLRGLPEFPALEVIARRYGYQL